VTAPEEPEDQGEIGELKKQYSSQLGMLKDMFPDWADMDLVLALQENDGDLPTTVDKITTGNANSWTLDADLLTT